MSARLIKASISVAIVSKGRPQILGETVESIFRQTLKPQQIVILAPSVEDLPQNKWGDDVEILLSAPRGTVQRNRAIAAVPLTVDYIAFFDDDVELSPDYLERAIVFMEANAGIVGFSGHLLINGGVNREQARKLIADFKPQRHYRSMFFSDGKDHILHGCNMMIRRAVLQYENFDEDLPLYSHAEDYDISGRLKHYGLIGKFEGCIGVHLETLSGRIHEKQRGYSLVANNFHFLKKRTFHLPLLTSLWKILKQDRSKDWTGRLKGILLAVSDIF